MKVSRIKKEKKKNHQLVRTEKKEKRAFQGGGEKALWGGGCP